MNADPVSGPAADESLTWLGDALYLVKGRKEHDELARALTERQADQAAAEAIRTERYRAAMHPIWRRDTGTEL